MALHLDGACGPLWRPGVEDDLAGRSTGEVLIGPDVERVRGILLGALRIDVDHDDPGVLSLLHERLEGARIDVCHHHDVRLSRDCGLHSGHGFLDGKLGSLRPRHLDTVLGRGIVRPALHQPPERISDGERGEVHARAPPRLHRCLRYCRSVRATLRPYSWQAPAHSP